MCHIVRLLKRNFTCIWDECNCDSLSIPWHCFSLGLDWNLTFSSPVPTAEFSKIAGILSAAFSFFYFVFFFQGFNFIYFYFLYFIHLFNYLLGSELGLGIQGFSKFIQSQFKGYLRNPFFSMVATIYVSLLINWNVAGLNWDVL